MDKGDSVSELHDMIQNALNKRALMGIYCNDELQVNYVMANNQMMQFSDALAEQTANAIMELESVKKLTEKAKNKEAISLGEFEACLNQIGNRNGYIGWVLESGSAEVKSLIRAQPKSPLQSEGRA